MVIGSKVSERVVTDGVITAVPAAFAVKLPLLSIDKTSSLLEVYAVGRRSYFFSPSFSVIRSIFPVLPTI